MVICGDTDKYSRYFPCVVLNAVLESLDCQISYLSVKKFFIKVATTVNMRHKNLENCLPYQKRPLV